MSSMHAVGVTLRLWAFQPSNFLFSSFIFNFLQSRLHFFHNREGSITTVYSVKKKDGLDSTDESYLHTGYEPKNYDNKKMYVESFTEFLTQPQFSEQRFLEDVDYDDTAPEEMLHNAHRTHVHHSQREGSSVGQSASSVSERPGRPVVERTGKPFVTSGQELNVGNAKIRTLLDRQKEPILAECQAEFWLKKCAKIEIIETQQEKLLRSCRRTLTTSSCTVITAKFGITWRS